MAEYELEHIPERRRTTSPAKPTGDATGGIELHVDHQVEAKSHRAWGPPGHWTDAVGGDVAKGIALRQRVEEVAACIKRREARRSTWRSIVVLLALVVFLGAVVSVAVVVMRSDESPSPPPARVSTPVATPQRARPAFQAPPLRSPGEHPHGTVIEPVHLSHSVEPSHESKP